MAPSMHRTTRETFRRQVLHQFVQGRIADYNPFDPSLPTNSPNAHYADHGRGFGCRLMLRNRGLGLGRGEIPSRTGCLGGALRARTGLQTWFPIELPDGQKLQFSPGKHNEVQKAIIEEFAPRFAPGAHLLYLGDTAKKNLFVDNAGLAELGIPITDHDKLPDVVLYDDKRNWLFLIEAVTSHGPVTPKRILEIEDMLSSCSRRGRLRQRLSGLRRISETSCSLSPGRQRCGLCDTPDHMIHYDGDRFLGPGS